MKKHTQTHLEVLGSRHNDLPQPRDPQRNVSPSVPGKVKRVKRHLRRWLSDRLSRDGPDRLSRRGQTSHVLHPHEELKRLFERYRGCILIVPCRRDAFCCFVLGGYISSQRWGIAVQERLEGALESLAYTPDLRRSIFFCVPPSRNEQQPKEAKKREK